MIGIQERTTIREAFFASVERHGDCPLLAVPANPQRTYASEGLEISYRDAGEAVADLIDRYVRAGYGIGHRIALLLENRPEHLLHKLAMNSIGACCVPLNPDHRPIELAFVIDHSRVDLIVVVEHLEGLLHEALEQCTQQPAVSRLDEVRNGLPATGCRAASIHPASDTIASILYTSGTTGHPKGCLLSHRYELATGHWYATAGGMVQIKDASERIFTPLPLFHVNASVFSFFCTLLTGNCQIQTDRFAPARWWTEVFESRATVFHCIGVIGALLLSQPPHPHERDHRVRFAIGGGLDPQQHAAFEERFGIPLIEIWGMTEMVRATFNNELPRSVGTRAIGRARPGLEVRVVDDTDRDMSDGVPGELLVRHSAETPRKDCFSGYLDDETATEHAWRGGWFHTGDVVLRDPDGLLHFVERRKNVIRRSGENIAAAEVEAALQTHPWVRQAAVIAVADELREEEVLACIVLEPDVSGNPPEVARTLFDHCNAQLAYYKPPGWVCFTDSIPTSGTQKVQKHQLFAPGIDPRGLPRVLDLRKLKRRRAPRT